MDGFNHASICWKVLWLGTSNLGDFWKVLKINFLMQLIDELTRRDAVLDVLLTNKKELMEDAKVKGSHGCSDHETVELKVQRGVNKINKITILDFRRANLGLFRDLLGKIPWETALESKGAQGSWVILKNNFLRAQEWFSPMCRSQAQQKAGMDEQGAPD